jgi:hypothetical protein
MKSLKELKDENVFLKATIIKLASRIAELEKNANSSSTYEYI